MKYTLADKFDLEEPFKNSGRDPTLIDALIPGIAIVLLLMAVWWIRKGERISNENS